MITNEISSSLKQAFYELQNAETELNRPLEDVVTLSACQAVRNSMKQIMHIYLKTHAVAAKEGASLSELLDSCIRLNSSFSGIDVTNIECKGDHANCNGKYCLSIESVAGCLNAANRLKDLIWWELKLNN